MRQRGGGWVGRWQSQNLAVHVYRIGRPPSLVGIWRGGADEGERLRDAILALKPAAQSSPLGEAVADIRRRHRGRALSGPWLLSDGITTEGPRLGGPGTPSGSLLAIGIGSPSDRPDLALGEVRAESELLRGDRWVVEATVRSAGIVSPVNVPLSLIELGPDGRRTERDRQTLTLAANSTVKVRLGLTADRPGEFRYLLELATDPRETDAANNRRELALRVSESGRLNVFHVEGVPRWEWRHLKTLLGRETDSPGGRRSVDYTTLLLTADTGFAKTDRVAAEGWPSRDEWAKLDALILGDIDPRQIPPSQQRAILEFVTVKGGGLIIQPGPLHGVEGWAASPLADLLPVTPAPGPEAPAADGHRPVPTPLGRQHPLFRLLPDEVKNGELWAELPPLFGVIRGLRAKPSAEVLAAWGAKGDVFAAQQFVGSGRVFVLASDETWRWRAAGGEGRWRQFWLEGLRLAARAGVRPPDIRCEPETPTVGEPCRLIVRFPEEAGPPGEARQPRLKIDAPSGGPSLLVELAPAGGPRQFAAAWTPELPGSHEAVMLGADGPTGVRGRVVVGPKQGEADRRKLDEADLREASRQPGGGYRPWALADELFDSAEVPEPSALDRPAEPWEIWNHPWLFALMLGLWASEWVARRRRGWV